MKELLSLKDFFLAPIYLGLWIFLAFIVNKTINKRTPHLGKFFMMGLCLRFVGSIAFGLIHWHFYAGDTNNYFTFGSKIIWEAFLDNPSNAFKIIFSDPLEFNPSTYDYILKIPLWEGSSPIIKVSAFAGLFTFHTYIPTAFLFAIICFSGLWAIYLTLLSYYPLLYKQLAYGILFFPSVLFWGSGIMKDPLTLGALGWAFYFWDKAFIKKEKVTFSIIMICITFWIISLYKGYILMCFIPTGFLYIFLHHHNKIKNESTRTMIKPLAVFFALFVSYFGIIELGKQTEFLDLENLATKSAVTYNYIRASGETTSSVYDIGEFDGSVESMVTALPRAINVSLFRPYFWEVKNTFIFMSAMESFTLLILTLVLLYRGGIMNILRLINKDPLINFLILFAMAFAFGTGVSTGNFGTLVRYKIPLIPFYVAAVLIIGYRLKEEKKQRKFQQTLAEISQLRRIAERQR